MDIFKLDRAAGLARLKSFVPLAGRDYAENRNYDHGPDRHHSVSRLSPYLRHRLIAESEVARAILSHHSQQACEKFIDELCWRTYWKGWLEMRPAVWTRYCSDVAALQADKGADYATAIVGNSGIDCFDAWVRELVDTGYLHNHARMWFASIWIFTLRLPWQLGADFFLHYLIDGDPASNTLSWRWVAGLHTPGKTYLARPDNIARYTGGRFAPRGLATVAPPVDGWSNPDPVPLAVDASEPVGRVGLLVHGDDLCPEVDWIDHQRFTAIAVLNVAAPGAPLVTAARGHALADTAQRLGGAPVLAGHEAIAHWAAAASLDAIVTPYVPVGGTRDAIGTAETSVPITMIRRAWDNVAWPCARAGFFGLKKKIPAILATL